MSLQPKKNTKDGQPTWGERDRLSVLNTDTRRLSAGAKVSGEALYSMDQRPEGMLFGRLVCVPVATAEFTLDLEPALAMDGVEGAIVLRKDKTLYNGQAVAAVAARTPELAEDAARAVKLEIKPLPWAVTAEQAMAERAPQVLGRRPNYGPRGAW